MIACVCSCNASRRTQGIDRLMTFVLDGLRERELSATRRFSRSRWTSQSSSMTPNPNRVKALKELMGHSRLEPTTATVLTWAEPHRQTGTVL